MPEMGEGYTDAEALAAAKAGAGVTEGDLVQVASGDKLPVIDGSNLTGLASTFVALTDITVVVKSADESVNNSNAFQDDDELKFAVGANEVWAFDLYGLLNANSAADQKFKWAIPTAGGGFWKVVSGNFTAIAIDAEIVIPATGSDGIARWTGVYIGGANAGTVQLQWAQNSAQANDAKVLKSTVLIARKLA